MPLIRKFAVQGHAVPNGYRPAYGPFPREILAKPLVNYGTEESDSLHEALDDVKMFLCKDCGDVLYQDQLSDHVCGADDE